MTVAESLQLNELSRKMDELTRSSQELKLLIIGKLAETDKVLRQVEGLLTTTPKKSGLMSQQELLSVITDQDPLSAVRKRTKRTRGDVVRTLLWIILFLGICALCNDTRGASWLAIPGLLAGAALLPSGLTTLYDGEGERL